MLRVLLVGAGADMSIADVESGYREALEQLAEVHFYNLTARIGVARKWVTHLWTMRGRQPDQQPGWPDAIYRASIEVLEMALRYEVDWVIVISGMFFHPDALILCRRAGVRTAVILTESPYQDPQQARLAQFADMVWTNERTSVDKLCATYLPAAYSPLRHRPDLPDEDDVSPHDVVFVGTGFRERIDLLRGVNWDGIDLGLYGEWALLGSTARLRRYVRGPTMPNRRAVALYRKAKIGLNLHRTSTDYGQTTPRIVRAESMNPRDYELAACEAFSLSDGRAELHEILGEAVPTFSTAAELESLIRSYLADATERQRLAQLARQRILPHTFSARAENILADLERCERRSLAKGA